MFKIIIINYVGYALTYADGQTLPAL